MHDHTLDIPLATKDLIFYRLELKRRKWDVETVWGTVAVAMYYISTNE